MLYPQNDAVIFLLFFIRKWVFLFFSSQLRNDKKVFIYGVLHQHPQRRGSLL
ncbi:hypothetical protein QY96_03705 [Bacillus thermotolerans]|nr:hypothetical protein QY96_03705 [Bacillus thermotolerans]